MPTGLVPTGMSRADRLNVGLNAFARHTGRLRQRGAHQQCGTRRAFQVHREDPAQHLEGRSRLTRGHVDEAAVVTLERDDDGVRRAVSVLGNNQVGFAGTR